MGRVGALAAATKLTPGTPLEAISWANLGHGSSFSRRSDGVGMGGAMGSEPMRGESAPLSA
jgi:hypothetical protein